MSDRINKDIITSRISSVIISDRFDRGYFLLRDDNFDLISLEEQVDFRLKKGINHDVSTIGNIVSEAIIYIPNDGIYMTKNSPLVIKPWFPVKANLSERDYRLKQDQIDKSLEDAIKFKPGIIPTNRFGDEKITSFIFGKKAKNYGDFLNFLNLENFGIYFSGKANYPFARQIYFSNINESYIIANRNLHKIRGIRGIKR